MPPPTSQSGKSAAAVLTPEIHPDEERLAHALITRGLVTRDEVVSCKPGPKDKIGPEGLLQRLVNARFMTGTQAKRTFQEMNAMVNQQIPGYQLLERLGAGSMGSVIKGRQKALNRLVAIKVLLPHLANNPEYLERFVREAHLAAKLSHNNIVQAIDVGSANGIHYFVMEFLEGTNIQSELDTGKIYPEKEAVEIVLQIADALKHAHAKNLIHRDIKPANIMLTADRVAKLADLGLARQTSDTALAKQEKGMAVGTPYYIAPEQVLGREDIDCRADIYSLGATLYHMVTGRPPFPGTRVDDVFKAHLEQELTPPDHLNEKLSAGLGEVVEFMMAKKRKDRYSTPDDLILDLKALLAGEPPKLARQRIKSSTLQDLAEGDQTDYDDEDDDEELSEDLDRPQRRGRRRGGDMQWLWIGILGVALSVSFLINIVLLLRR